MVCHCASSWEMLVPLSEREDIGADPGIQEFDLEGSIADRPCLPDELVHTRFAHAPPSASTSKPWSAPGGAPSSLTRKRMG